MPIFNEIYLNPQRFTKSFKDTSKFSIAILAILAKASTLSTVTDNFYNLTASHFLSAYTPLS